MTILKYFCVVLVIFYIIPRYQQLILENTITKQNGSATEPPIKSRLLYDYQTHAVAFKDLIESKCILEILTGSDSVISKWNSSGRRGSISKDFLNNELLSKRQIWRLAGDRITEFCRGFPTYLIKNNGDGSQDFLNDIPNFIEKTREKRATSHYFQGRVRGQTQSQYLNFGKSDQPGKAEAESSFEGSKAIVSGNNGMGQAQSQSLPFDCGDCFNKDQNQVIEMTGYPAGQYPEPIIQGPVHSEGGTPVSNFSPGQTGSWTGKIPSGKMSGPDQTESSNWPRPGISSNINVPSENRDQISSPIGPTIGQNQRGGQSGVWPKHPGESIMPTTQGQTGIPGQVSVWPGQTGREGQTGRWPGQTQGPTNGQNGGINQIERQPDGKNQIGGWPATASQLPGGRHDSTSQITGGKTDGTYPITGGGPNQNQSPRQPGDWSGHSQSPQQISSWPGQVQAPSQTGNWQGQLPAPSQTASWPGQFQAPQGPGQNLRGTTTSPTQSGAWSNQPSSIAQPGGWGQQMGWPGQNAQTGATFPGRWTGQISRPSDQINGPNLTNQPSNGQTGSFLPNTGSFGGNLAGDYQSNQGQYGRFSGQFSGQYESYGPRGPPVGGPRNVGQVGGTSGQRTGQYGDTGSIGAGQLPGYVERWPNQLTDNAQVLIPSQNVNWPGGIGDMGPGQIGSWSNQINGPGQQEGKWPSRGQGGTITGRWPGQRGEGFGQTEGGSGTGQTGDSGMTIGHWPGQTVGVQEVGQGGSWPGQVGGTGQIVGPVQRGDTSNLGNLPNAMPGRIGSHLQGGENGQVGGWPGVSREPGQVVSQPDQTRGSNQGPGQAGSPGQPTSWPGHVGDTGQVGAWPSSIGGMGQVGPDQTGGNQIGKVPGQQIFNQGGGWPGQINGGPSGPISVSGTGGRNDQGGSWPGQTGGYDQFGNWPNNVRGPGQYGYNQVSGRPGQMEGTGQIGQPGTIGETGGNQFGVQPEHGQNFVPNGGAGQGNQNIPGLIRRPNQGAGQISDGRYTQTDLNDDSDSQVQTSVQQNDNETIAQAQAQGTYGGGTAQSQVSGSYSGSGSFSASAGSDDGKRGAQTQIAGGKTGAQSSAQGKGGLGQSQSQVTLSLETGQTSSSAQTGGINHSTQSQVLASEKGGLADAQSNGPGSTSSQAQIGFVPYDEQDSDNGTEPFRGGGTAGARSGSFSGMSQSQVQGKFQFGVKYTGAAQAASGGAGFGKNFTRTGPFNPKEIKFNVAKEKLTQNQMEQTVALKKQQKNTTNITPQESPITTTRPISTKKSSHKQTNNKDYDEDEDYYQDYEEETEKPMPKTIITQSEYNQRQHIVLDPLEDLDVTVHQSKGDAPSTTDTIMQPGETVPGFPGFKIPSGFRGTLKSIANGPNTYAIGKHSQAQSATLSPGTGKIIYKQPVYAVTSNTHSTNGQYGYGSGYTYQPAYSPISYQLKSGRILPHFISSSKSETGSTNLFTGKKTPSVYYTQSSTCGLFTNQCIFNAGRKLCFPKAKTNPDGTIMGC